MQRSFSECPEALQQPGIIEAVTWEMLGFKMRLVKCSWFLTLQQLIAVVVCPLACGSPRRVPRCPAKATGPKSEMQKAVPLFLARLVAQGLSGFVENKIQSRWQSFSYRNAAIWA